VRKFYILMLAAACGGDAQQVELDAGRPSADSGIISDSSIIEANTTSDGGTKCVRPGRYEVEFRPIQDTCNFGARVAVIEITEEGFVPNMVLCSGSNVDVVYMTSSLPGCKAITDITCSVTGQTVHSRLELTAKSQTHLTGTMEVEVSARDCSSLIELDATLWLKR